MTKQQHNIEKISINVNTLSSKIGNLYKDKFPEIINSEFLVEADSLFSSICSENENLIIEQIALEINVDSGTDFSFLKKQLIDRLKERLQEAKAIKLNSKKTEFSTEINTAEKQNYNSLGGYLYFLKTGLKPWWVSKEKLNDLLQGNFKSIFKDTENLSVLINEILAHNSVQERFMKQQSNALSMFYFLLQKEMPSPIETEWKTWKSKLQNVPYKVKALSEKFIHPLFLNLIAEKQDVASIEKNIITSFEFIFNKWIEITDPKEFINIKEAFQSLVDKTLSLFNILSDKKINQKNIQLLIQKITNQTEDYTFQLCNNEDLEIVDQVKKDSKTTENEPIEDKPYTVYLTHAGLILVYPFIKELFKSCNLLTKSGDIISNDIAVHLLYYVATKNLKPQEYELTLEKILCGIPIQTPIEKEVKLSEQQIYEAEQMLEAVSEHWTAIKNSSPDAIRSTFLIREGKLETGDFDKKLFIQRKTEDILINKLPWSISIVKTPWMKQFLTVEW